MKRLENPIFVVLSNYIVWKCFLCGYILEIPWKQIKQLESMKRLSIVQSKEQDFMIIKLGRHICLRICEVRKDLWAFFLDCAFRMLIGWAGKL